MFSHKALTSIHLRYSLTRVYKSGNAGCTAHPVTPKLTTPIRTWRPDFVSTTSRWNSRHKTVRRRQDEAVREERAAAEEHLVQPDGDDPGEFSQIGVRTGDDSPSRLRRYAQSLLHQVALCGCCNNKMCVKCSMPSTSVGNSVFPCSAPAMASQVLWKDVSEDHLLPAVTLVCPWAGEEAGLACHTALSGTQPPRRVRWPRTCGPQCDCETRPPTAQTADRRRFNTHSRK
ncbi:unnamed protein product [Nesidiocoris tenuis]|uniref:Uncharacterized protein n=1 Tax=Nesidiocoris tenuis TaxID=355587 RepID=A0A6H5GDR3_9HEMI|nr:unnamed protein product [Nesidiocoris tenuis]